MNGYRFSLPNVEVTPAAFAPSGSFFFEALSDVVVGRAMDRRNKWLANKLVSASSFFSNIMVTAGEIEEFVRVIETDLSLVHAAYYFDDDCIELVAGHIAAIAQGAFGDAVRDRSC